MADFLDPPGAISRLVAVIVNPDDAGPLVDQLVAKEFRLTRLATAGGFLRRGNVTLLLGIPASRLDELLEIVQSECSTRTILSYDLFSQSTPDMLPSIPVDVEVGGATVFVLEVEKVIYLESQ